MIRIHNLAKPIMFILHWKVPKTVKLSSEDHQPLEWRKAGNLESRTIKRDSRHPKSQQDRASVKLAQPVIF